MIRLTMRFQNNTTTGAAWSRCHITLIRRTRAGDRKDHFTISVKMANDKLTYPPEWYHYFVQMRCRLNMKPQHSGEFANPHKRKKTRPCANFSKYQKHYYCLSFGGSTMTNVSSTLRAKNEGKSRP